MILKIKKERKSYSRFAPDCLRFEDSSSDTGIYFVKYAPKINKINNMNQLNKPIKSNQYANKAVTPIRRKQIEVNALLIPVIPSFFLFLITTNTEETREIINITDKITCIILLSSPFTICSSTKWLLTETGNNPHNPYSIIAPDCGDLKSTTTEHFH